ncbi:MAG: HAMP domain-containing protein [Alphaproteobacteria bacterium]|nr:HAMP domain-containing protein [Alphaproteobacteria bacterium]
MTSPATTVGARVAPSDAEPRDDDAAVGDGADAAVPDPRTAPETGGDLDLAGEAPSRPAVAPGSGQPSPVRRKRTRRRRRKSRSRRLSGLPRLMRTTAIRFTFLYVVVFAISVTALGVFFYGSTFAVVDRQTDQIINQDLVVLGEVFQDEGPGTLRRLIRERAAWRDNGVYMMIGAPSGALLAGNLTALPAEALAAGEGFFNFTYERTTVDAAGRPIGEETRRGRGKLRRFKTSPDVETSFLVFVARDITSHEGLRDRSREQITRIGAATIALGLLIGLAFSRSLLRRVEAVNRISRAIRDGDLSRRIALNGSNDELDHLSMNLNAMLDQIERLMTGMKEVSDNIAHDLRSPLTRIQARLNDAINADDQTKEEALRATLRDSERMLGTFNALLSIARIESGEGAGGMAPLDVGALAEELAELYEPAAQEAGFDLTLAVQRTPPARGSRALIGQALANMLDNALKYAVGGDRLLVEVAPMRDGRIMLAVEDDGPGIPAEDRESVLKRFVRLERSRTSEGSGLGLSLVAAVARAHGAALVLADAKRIGEPPTRPGLRIELTLPPAASHEDDV